MICITLQLSLLGLQVEHQEATYFPIVAYGVLEVIVKRTDGQPFEEGQLAGVNLAACDQGTVFPPNNTPPPFF